MSRMKSTFRECNKQRTWRVQQNAAELKLYYGLSSSDKNVLLDWDFQETVAKCTANVSFTASNSADNGEIKRIEIILHSNSPTCPFICASLCKNILANTITWSDNSFYICKTGFEFYFEYILYILT